MQLETMPLVLLLLLGRTLESQPLSTVVMMTNSDNVRDIPSHIVKKYSKISLYIDVMHVNGIMFLVGASKYIGFIQCVA